jgi:virginiamycin B lyase
VVHLRRGPCHHLRRLEALGRITTAGQIRFFSLPSDQTGDVVNALANGPHGTLWFSVSDPHTGQTGIDTIASGGQITELPVSVADVQALALGTDGAMWLTDMVDNSIDRVTASGQITSYRIPSPQSEPTSIAAGPDGALWFTEYAVYKLGRITPTGRITEYPVKIGKPYDEPLQPAEIANGPGRRCGSPNNGSARRSSVISSPAAPAR